MELTDAEILKVIEPMMDDIVAGISQRDYKKHSTNFSVNLKSTLGSEEFIAACDQREGDWGFPGEREVLSIFRKQKSFTVVWNQYYSRTDEDIMAMTTIALKGGRYFVDHFMLH